MKTKTFKIAYLKCNVMFEPKTKDTKLITINHKNKLNKTKIKETNLHRNPHSVVFNYKKLRINCTIEHSEKHWVSVKLLFRL